MASKVEVTNKAGQTTILLDGELPFAGGKPEARIVLGRMGSPGRVYVLDNDANLAVRFECQLGAHLHLGSPSGQVGMIHMYGLGKESIFIDAGNSRMTFSNKLKQPSRLTASPATYNFRVRIAPKCSTWPRILKSSQARSW